MTTTRFFSGGLEPLGEREIGVVAATSQLGRDGHVLEPAGMDLAGYRSNPIVLWSHSPEAPVGVATQVGMVEGNLCARIAFAPAGLSPLADEICALTKVGIVRGISVGFEPTESEPLDPRRPHGGQHILRSELLELCVSIPADVNAQVVARSAGFRIGQRSIPRVPVDAVQRAMSRIGPRAAVLSHTMQVWALQRERGERWSYAARQRALAELRERIRRNP